MISSFNSDNQSGLIDMTDLTLLLVEDDELSRELALLQLNGLFMRVIAATDGADGLRLFKEVEPDIVLSDQLMPVLSGMEMFREIRKLDQNVPLLLTTSSMENETLLEAINLGITRFIPKPFDNDLIVRVLNDIARELTGKRKLEESRLQEIELLRYRDSYNSMQQAAARRKERHVARHDLRNLVVKGAADNRWGFRVTNAPKDTMSGDGYTIRNLFDGRQLVFVVDAMGSGLSASLSALLATSFCNYQIEHLHKWSAFSLNSFLARFKEYMSCILLEDEALSCGFLLVDLVSEEIDVAIFGLPPLLLRKFDGTVERLLGTNPPLSTCNGNASITRRALNNIADLMIMTDGITEASLPDGDEYRKHVLDDFRRSPTLASLLRRFRFATKSDDCDDLTILHLQRLDLPASWFLSLEPAALQLPELVAMINVLVNELNSHITLGETERKELETLLNEALLNAFEHGCLGINHIEKARLKQSGSYEAFLQQAAPSNARIILSARIWQGAESPLLILEISDNGPGFNAVPIWSMTDESGLKKIRNLCDSLFVGGTDGGKLIILKTLMGE